MYEMGSKEDEYIYHLTSLENLESIIENGLLPRSHLIHNNHMFEDNGDHEIIAKRNSSNKLLFHLTPYNVFSYQFRGKKKDWIYLLVEKEKLIEFDYKVIVNHPLSGMSALYNTIEEASEYIDWNQMKYPYSKWYDSEKTIDISKIKMSEVQINGTLNISDVSRILVADISVGIKVRSFGVVDNIEIEVKKELRR